MPLKVGPYVDGGDKQRGEFLAEELGDILWYVSNLAQRLGFDLTKIAEDDLSRVARIHGGPAGTQLFPALDAKFADGQRFPRKMKFLFEESKRDDGTPIVALKLLSAEPNPFPDGASTDAATQKRIGFSVGAALTDNSRGETNYRYHDVIHIAFMAVLGWSPVMRELLRIKRKDDPVVDEVEDGAKAKDTEEGISTYLTARAPKFGNFSEPAMVDGDTLDLVVNHTMGLEVVARPGWLWRDAIVAGFRAFHALAENHGGCVTVDLDARTVIYDKL